MGDRMGLAAEELATETLFPGDTVEYFSMAFVAGDPRGHRVAKILRVTPSDGEYPLRLDSQEILPMTLMIKRKLDRHGTEIAANETKWRKLRTFKLVGGQVEGETRADRLNKGMAQSMVDAIQSTKKIWAAKKAKKKKSQRRDSHERAKDEADDFFETAMQETSKPKPKSKKAKDQDVPTKKQKSLLSNFFRPRVDTAAPTSSSPFASKRMREDRDSPQLPRKSLHGGAKRPHSSISSHKSSKYFQKEQRYDSQKTPKKKIRQTEDYSQVRKSPKVNLQGFIDTLEVQKASTNNLDEYLALESKQKELLGSSEKTPHRQTPAKLQKTNRFASQSSGSSSGGKSSWVRDRERFRQKQGTGQIKASSESMDTWLSRKASTSPHDRSPGMKKKRISRVGLETISSPAPRVRHPDRDREAKETGLSFMMQKDTATSRDSHQRSPLHKKRHEPAVRKQGLMKSWVARKK